MTKEEILARSRNEKKDEGTEYIASRGRRWGVAAMSLMYLALIVFNWFNGQDNYQLMAVFWAYLGFEAQPADCRYFRPGRGGAVCRLLCHHSAAVRGKRG